MVYSFFNNNRLISIEPTKEKITIVSEEFDSQVWTYHLLRVDDNQSLEQNQEKGFPTFKT